MYVVLLSFTDRGPVHDGSVLIQVEVGWHVKGQGVLGLVVLQRLHVLHAMLNHLQPGSQGL